MISYQESGESMEGLWKYPLGGFYMPTFYPELPDRQILNLLYEYVEHFKEPATEKRFQMLRQSLIEYGGFAPYSQDLYQISSLFANGEFQEVIDMISKSMPNLILSPLAHKLASRAYSKLGREQESGLEKLLFAVCILGILATGDGSIQKPYLVTRVSDEYDVLLMLKKELRMQASCESNGRSLDVLMVNDGSSIHFDITDCMRKL